MGIRKTENGFELHLGETDFAFESKLVLEEKEDCFILETVGAVPTPKIEPNDRLLLPVDEGIAVTADREYENGEFDCNCFQGSFCSREGTMSMVIIERKKKYLLIALNDGTHAGFKAQRQNGLYGLEITCHAPCRVLYGLFSSLATACACYREYGKKKYLTLKEKIAKNPEIEKLIGGAIFWVWSEHYDKVMYSDKDVDISPAVGNELLSVADELKKNGVDRAMFGLFFDEDSYLSEKLYTKHGYLSTQYDNYNDIFDPALLNKVPNNRIKNCGYTYRRMKDHPDGICVTKDGKLAPAWALKGFDGNMYSQNTCCPSVASQRMQEEIPEILKKYPYYKGRFIDVYGTGLSECHSPTHPLTRGQCLKVKKEAFASLESMGLIVGTEDGFEDLIDSLTYTEGLHSPVYFRIPNAGRNHAHNYSDEQSRHIQKHMTDPTCRVPLWQLVHHDHLIAFPYWGDSTEASHVLLRRKTLFACLYGCPPLYSFCIKDFQNLKNDILESYRTISDIHKKTALLPMTDFRILSDDCMLQKSVFGNKLEITVNFSDTERSLDGQMFEPYDVVAKEL